MKMIFLALFAVTVIAASVVIVDAQNGRKVFPYEYKINDLPNGLRVITVPTDYPNLVALYTVVGAGSRNEVEPGKSGYAHFFEHLMFRGSENFPPGSFERIMKKAGASSNAYTTDDRTVYHATFAKEDLDEIMRLEADRFQRLKYELPEYKTEALAVLGEYNKNSASPIFKMHEVLRETAYKKHTYSHTTMGYLKDIEDYPNQFEYSWQFYNRFYRPEYTTIIVVGDVKPDEVAAMVNKYYGSWQPGNYKSQIPVETPQDKARSEHIEWTSPTLPYVAVAYRGPAFSDESKEKAALDLLSLIAFGENSDLYQKLVLQEQKADFISPDFEDRIDPELFTVYARVKSDNDLNYVRDEIAKTFRRYTNETVPQKLLDQTRSRMRYGFALAMNSNDAIASTLAPYIALKRTPETLEKLFALYDRITPEDIRAAARTYFQDKNQTVVTLATKNGGKK
ncbi:MAG: insulinase family protein [Acidobacteriota bacterium]|nr:insulinase family protein [Acidobacteriota bacterium]